MCVARTAARRRKQIAADPRYGRPKATISKKLQGRAKLYAQRDACAAAKTGTVNRSVARQNAKQTALAQRLAARKPQ